MRNNGKLILFSGLTFAALLAVRPTLALKTQPTPAAAEVVGPSEVEPGMPAVFTLRGMSHEHIGDFDWQLFRKPKDAMVLDLADRAGNPVMVVWTKTTGVYAIIADVNVPGEYRLIVHEFTVGEPVPPPPPITDVATRVLALARKVPGDAVQVRKECRTLAAAYRGLAAKIEALTLVKRDEMPVKVREANKSALGTRLADWQPFVKEWGKMMDELEPERGQTIAAIGKLLTESAEGLAAY